MSYVVAFVKFSHDSESTYAVECFREDLKKGDMIILQSNAGKFHSAIFEKWEYLNWVSNARIYCKLSELKSTNKVIQKGFVEFSLIIKILVERK